MEAVGGEAGDDAVIEQEPVLAQQQRRSGTARAADCAKRIDIHAFKECGGIRPDHLDLAERGRIENAGGTAHGAAFAGDRVRMVSPARGK